MELKIEERRKMKVKLTETAPINLLKPIEMKRIPIQFIEKEYSHYSIEKQCLKTCSKINTERE